MRTFGFLALCFVLWASAMPGCVSAEKNGHYGLQAEHLGFVPARTAILPCQVWPAGARYAAMPLSSAKPDELAMLCERLDAYILSSFVNQPYMKGFSPRFVTSQIAAAGIPSVTEAITTTWHRDESTCTGCKNVPAFYRASIAKRAPWQAWLSRLSQASRNADAALLPFVTYADERRYSDRGLKVAERLAGVTLLLIDTATGDLIWAGAREAVVPAKQLARQGLPDEPEMPSWDPVIERLLTEDLLREYPGRQVF